MPLRPYLHRVVERENLNALDAREAMSTILEGRASQAQIAAFLIALRMKGETVDELVGFARAMRRAATPVVTHVDSEPLVDTCGTGGDGAQTFNISTIAAFVIAGAGVRVAKHGNRSISSRCGSADLVEGLGVNIGLPADLIGKSIREVGIGFLFAPMIHTAMRHAQPVRLELRVRTVFNLLGPLTNPAGARVQLVGASSKAAAELMARALAALNLECGWVVHGSDGMDEITTTGLTHAWEIVNGSVFSRELQPEDFGVGRAKPEDLKGGDLETNLAIARKVLEGEKGPARDIVVVNAGAALVAAGRAHDLEEGARRAAEAIDSGAAKWKVKALADFSQTAAARTA